MVFQNSMKRALKEGKTVYGPMISEIRSPGMATFFANAGFDFFFLDTEHSCFDLQTVSDYVMAARASNIPIIVRPPTRESHEALSRPLDIGASGLLIPQVQCKKDVENIVAWTRYMPLGDRGMALERQHTHFDPGVASETMAKLNEEVLIAVQIESKDAIENLDEILSVPGIDVATDPVVEAAIQKVIDVSRKYNIVPGIHLSNIEQIKKWKDRGMRMLGYGTDIKFIQQVCKQAVQDLRALN